MPDAVVYSDRDGIIRYWNQGAERMFGHLASDTLGQSLDMIIPEAQRARHWQGFHETMRTGHSRYSDGQTLAVPALHRDGRRISVAFTIVPFRDAQGAMTGMAAIMRDVTAQFEETRALRKELAALRERGHRDG